MVNASEQTVDLARQENVTRILDVAERLFRHYGYAKTNVADIARELGMSPANVYRFFPSKGAIHQAIAERMLEATYQITFQISKLPLSAEERLRLRAHTVHKHVVETMLDEEKVHEMVVVAMDQQWQVIENFIDRVDGVVATIIADGIAAGEFRPQDTMLAARCFDAALITLCHPQMVAQCLRKENRASADDLIDFAIRALKP